MLTALRTPTCGGLTVVQVLQQAATRAQEAHTRSPPVDISRFLHPVEVWEMKHVRRLCNLCALTYKLHLVTPEGLRRRHGLSLVASSWAAPAAASTPAASATAYDAAIDSDGMAANVQAEWDVCSDDRAPGAAPTLESAPSCTYPTAAAIPAAVAASAAAGVEAEAKAGQQPAPGGGGETAAAHKAVAVKLAEAAKAAAAAAAAAATPLTSAAGNLYAGLSIGASKPDGSAGDAAQPAADHAVQTAAAATAVTTAMAPAAALCPSEWFILDKDADHVRTFVVQGSDSIDHWRLNLTFDPVTFEDDSLGVTVHRGVYEAACQLYHTFLPHVQAHLSSSPFARVAFTGHSIGGSLATLLLLMYIRRGVLTPRAAATVYTFGAPSVFCETGGAACEEAWGCNGDSSGDGGAAGSTAGSGECGGACGECGGLGQSRLLLQLGLPGHAVRNVMMSRDIVPRAFSCDYSPVSDLLADWGTNFRDHGCLGRRNRKLLYFFVGRSIVIQPDREWQWFASSEGDHPLLPAGPGMYFVEDFGSRQPESGNSLVSSSSGSSGSSSSSNSIDHNGSIEHSSGSGRNRSSGTGGSTASGKSNTSSTGGHPAASTDAQVDGQHPLLEPQAAVSAHEAVLALMDCPHPLETLLDRAAYMEKGSISRYHNPDNYCAAIGRAIHLASRPCAQPWAPAAPPPGAVRRERVSAAASTATAAAAAYPVPSEGDLVPGLSLGCLDGFNNVWDSGWDAALAPCVSWVEPVSMQKRSRRSQQLQAVSDTDKAQPLGQLLPE
mmetsp:Transcript_37569/g.111035  ORF Transcript_37569/g.111035 Transcript_37569/m.111035 type:complete len:778 (-) Transcript_37569:90-2423(-)